MKKSAANSLLELIGLEVIGLEMIGLEVIELEMIGLEVNSDELIFKFLEPKNK